MLSTNCRFFRLGLLAMAFCMLAIASYAQASDVTGNVTFATSSRESTFGFDSRNGMIFVPVRLNGSRPLSFVLDTGSARTVVDRALATSPGAFRMGASLLRVARCSSINVCDVWVIAQRRRLAQPKR